MDSLSSDIPQKQCRGCKNYFDATSEYFYVTDKQTGRLNSLCKTCYNTEKMERYREKHPKKEEIVKPTKEELNDLYNKQKLTTYQIGDLLGYPQQTISKWLIKEGLNRQINKPTRNELETMYTIEQLTCRQIAKKLGVAASSIKNWLREYDIERRQGAGLAYHGKEIPTREKLYNLVHVEHMSYEEIGKIYGIDKAAIPHWMEKYDIPKPRVWDTRLKGDTRTKPSREELAALYDSGLSLTAIGDMFGYNYGVMIALCNEYGIEIRPNGWGEGKRYLCQDGHMVRSLYEQRTDDWLYAHNVAHTYEPKLPWHKSFKSDFLANGWYIEVWGVTNNETYNRRREQKLQLYRQHNAPLIELPIHFFSKQKQSNLERRLSQCLTKPIV